MALQIGHPISVIDVFFSARTQKVTKNTRLSSLFNAQTARFRKTLCIFVHVKATYCSHKSVCEP